ncbi:TPA: UDP-N-acetylglucosamine 2-epimerase (hydrolyzing) [Streptococcus agalactiae]|uniref:Putative UDP-N-acetylglucosamine-2-epimerase NeuC n=2 Tax=Streptococcus agalactiae TaxID=1311 RepID=Q9ALW5_STRAG|nr:UDP-N-acetylglucosamine 2-epimerase [Streptococcus agalactiae]AAK11671.1 putative UDP-N-acetylglucosamine-2-epimerase NeuC [Streptococcus agalactiae]APS25200.1 UDP-N-acetyl glucosamine 2-epimerase [Streptococcus agalactiae]ASA92389.1 UDP-N-acetylglucosamine 2-epimerase (hydrolyzing) [Streptococcus agalactiae]AWZ33608.1 UDP-N-acetylglucosamine 2-epimerase (hydrolyzing) [Streptococcus agalactiae]EPU63244.1 UDP-N-acetylglucosamine 2-epimerase [Streptococcus agalactiae GB00083]
MKKICLVTGSRAEYGIMKPLIQRLSKDKEVNLQIIATAMHLEEKYGYTYRQIEEDGFDIAYKVPLHLYDTDRRTVSTAMAHLQLGLTKIFDKEDYDLVIILGDRYEMLPVVNVALIYNVPVCHLHGGETSLGNFDEYIRHAITKMSHLHLVSTEDFRQRVIQMGEQPQFVINTGALGVENALSIPPLTKEAIEKQLGIALEESYFVVLYHPVTFEQGKSAGEQMKAVLSALSKFGVQCLFIGSNSDTGSDDIAKAINTYLTNHENSHCFASLSTQLYHSLIRHSLGLIGNSSSGLIEVPSLMKPTLNIGDRQKGRLHGESVVSVPVETSSVLEGLSKLNEVTNFDNPYYKENASSIAYEAIKLYLKDEPSISQPFYDLKENNLK